MKSTSAVLASTHAVSPALTCGNAPPFVERAGCGPCHSSLVGRAQPSPETLSTLVRGTDQGGAAVGGEVGESFADLGRRVSEHYRKLGLEQAAKPDQDKVRDALRTISDQLDQAFTSLGDTLRDPGAKQSMDRVVKTFGNAMNTTFEHLGEKFRGRPQP